MPVRGSLSHLSRSDHDAAEIRGDQIRRKSSRRRECHPAPQPAQGDGGNRTIDGRVMSHCPGAHPRLHAPCRRDDVDQALAALRADALATGFATRPSQSCGGRRQTVAALTSLRFLPRTSTSRSKTPTGLLARSTSGIPRCRKRHDGLQRWSSAPRAKLRTRSASLARPLSTITGNSGSRREASPSAARSRSSNTKPLTPSKLRSSTTSAGWRTSIALRPSPTLLAPATRNPSAAKLSSRNARVSSSSSTTKIRRCASIATRRSATQNLAPFAQVSPSAGPSSRWGPVKRRESVQPWYAWLAQGRDRRFRPRTRPGGPRHTFDDRPTSSTAAGNTSASLRRRRRQ